MAAFFFKGTGDGLGKMGGGGVFLPMGAGAGASAAEAVTDPATDSDPWTRGLVFERASSYEEAVAEFMQVPEGDPHRTQAWRELGVCEAYLGRRVEASAALDRYLALNPADTEIKAYISRLRAGEAPQAAAAAPSQPGADASLFGGAAKSEDGSGILEEPFRPTYGVRLGGGYGWAYNNFTYGEPVNVNGGYDISEPTGQSWEAEALYAPVDWFEVGLGYFPLYQDATISSADCGNYGPTEGGAVTASGTNTVSETLSPIVLTLYDRHRLFSKSFHVVLGMGMGYVPATTLLDNGSQQWDASNGSWSWANHTQIAFASGAAFRGVLGGEYSLNRWCDIFAFYQYLGIMHSRTQDSNSEVESLSDGTVVYDNQQTINYSSNPVYTGITSPGVTSTTSGGLTTTITASPKRLDGSVEGGESPTSTPTQFGPMTTKKAAAMRALTSYCA